MAYLVPVTFVKNLMKVSCDYSTIEQWHDYGKHKK